MNRYKKKWLLDNLSNIVDTNHMVIFCHYNSITSEEWIKLKLELSNLSIKTYYTYIKMMSIS